MKILIATNHSYMLWQFRRELLQKLAEKHEIVISTPFVGHQLELESVGCRLVETKLERRSVDPVKDLQLLRFYGKLLRREQPELVLTFSIKPNVYMGMVCRRAGIPYCGHVQGLGTAFQKKSLAKVTEILYRMGLKNAYAVFFENQDNADQFVEKSIIPREKVRLLPGAGVNLDYHRFQTYPVGEPVRFLYLGRIMKEKGVDELFSAIRRLREVYGSRVILDLVGFFEDEYKEQVEELTAQGIVKFYGFQEHPHSYYCLSHCVVLPSYHEGMSNVLLEAAATGRPLIASRIPGCQEAITPGENGFLCQPRNEDSLFQAMDAFMRLRPEQRAEMGLKSRMKVQHEFDREQVVARTQKVLMEAVHG